MINQNQTNRTPVTSRSCTGSSPTVFGTQLVDNACVAETNQMYAVVEIVTTHLAGILLLNWFVLPGAGCRATGHHTIVSFN